MWRPNDGNVIEERGRVNSGADMVVMDERALAAALPPTVSNLNVTKSSKVHVGPKFVSVTQNVHNAEVVKGHFLGLELVSSKHARRLRCSVAVFICWALIVASGLIIYLIYIAMPKQTRLDIELPLCTYICNVIKNSSRTERLSCAAAVIVLIICITLIIYFTVQSTQAGSAVERPPHEWKITRDMWLAQPANHSTINEKFKPLMLVIIQHTVSGECINFIQCAAELRNIQGWFLKSKDYDIPYNFIIGNDGRVYEGRGWNIEGAHTFGYNTCTLGIGFIGDYREERPNHTRVTESQLNRTRMLFEDGVRMGYLRPDFVVVGAKDVQSTASPGSNLLNAIREWDNYDHQHRFRGMNCTEIQEKYGDQPL